MRTLERICGLTVIAISFIGLLACSAMAEEDLLAERSASMSELSMSHVKAVENDGVEVNFFTQVWSKYLTSSGWDVSQGKAVSQNDLSITYKSFTAEIWTSSVFGESISDAPGDEVDFILTWNGRLPATWSDKIDWSIGLAYYDCSKLFNGTSVDIIQPFFEAKREFKLSEDVSIFPYIRGEFSFLTDGGTNTNAHLGLGHFWQITPKFKWSTKVAAVIDDGGGAVDSGVIAMVRSGFNYAFNNNVNVDVLSIKATDPISGAKDRELQVAASAGLNIKF